MAISNLQDLRDTAPAQFRDLPADELVREYSRSIGMPFSQAADFFGVAPRGTLAEMGRQAYGGLVSDLPKMVGQGLQATGLAPQYGKEMAQAAEARAPQYEPDMRGRGLLGQAGVYGARGLAPVVATAPLAFVPGVGTAAAAGAAATLFGTSAYQETYDKLVDQGIDPEQAKAAALRVGFTQGPLEGLSTVLGVRAAKGLSPLLGIGGKTTAGVAGEMTETGIAKPFLKSMATNAIVQPGTEVAQDVGTSLVERAYGAKPEDLGEIAKQSALGGLGLTMLLGPLSIGGHVSRARRAESLKDALYSEDTPPEVRQKAISLVTSEARRQGVQDQDIGAWVGQQIELEDARTEALRVAEEQRKTEQINLLGGKAQELEGLQGGMFSSLEQQKAFEQGLSNVQPTTPFSSLEQQKAFEQGLETVRNQNVERVGQQYQDLMASRASTLMQAQDLGQQAQEILAPQQRGLAAAQEAGDQWQELRAKKYRTMLDIEDMGQAWQKLAKELPQPVTGELSSAQKAALRGPKGKRFKPTSSPIEPVSGGPMATTLLQPAQAQDVMPAAVSTPETAPSSLLSDRPAIATEQAQVSPPGAPAAVAAVTPSTPVVEGASLQGTPSGTQAPQTQQATPQGQKAPVRVAERQTPEQQAQDELGLTQALQVANRANVSNNPLQAGIEGAGKVAAPGKTSLNVASLRNIRDALLNPSATVDGISAKDQKIADAVRAFAKAYYKFSNAGGNMLRGVPTERAIKGENGETIYKPTKLASLTPAQQRGQIKAKTGKRVDTTLEHLQATRDALGAVGAAVKGNAKDVEAIIKMVKDMVQRELHTEVDDEGMNEDFGQTGADKTAAAFEKLDTMLSQGWNAAKANMFRGDSDAGFVRQTPIRSSKEATAAGEAQTPLEKAAQGYAKFDKGESSKGILGVLNYIQTHGTPFERTIAKGVFQSLYDSDTAPSVKFITEGKPYYDPKTNTVYIQRDASAAVTLHEALHSALQWYVYQNPNAPEVRALKASLKRVVNFKGELGADAKRVQDVLKALMKDKKELDAVLELVSYGNTLNDFRRALEGMDSTEAPKTFFDAAKNVWQSILTAVHKLVGGKPSVAADVIGNTFKLLEAAGSAQKGKPVGNVLQAAVEATIPQPSQQSDEMNLQKYKDTPGWTINITRSFLEHAGFGEGGRVEAAARKMMDKAADKVVTEFPQLTGNLRNIASKFGLNTEYKQAAAVSKQEKQSGLVEAEALLQRLYRSPKDAVRVLGYLNGDQNALGKTGHDNVLRDTADAIKELIDSYVKTLPPTDRRLLERMKFTDMLLKPEALADLAKKSFGMHSVSAIFRPEDRVETNIEDFKNLLPMKSGVVDSDKPLFQTFELFNGQRIPKAFVGEEQANDHPELDIDRSRVWYFQGQSKGPNGGYKFRTRNISGTNLMDVARRMGDETLSTKEKEEAAQQVSSALLTTISALSHNAATKNLFASLEPMGRNEDGSASETTAVFKDIAEINSVFPDRKLTDANLLQASDDESKIKYIRSIAQRGDVWVKLPDTSHYGPLRGKIISGGMWSDMLDMHDREPLLNNETLNNLLAAFKKNKTVFSPATHANNILTNYALMLLHGISHKAVGDAANLIVKYELSPGLLNDEQRAIMKAFYKSGAVLGNFTNAETKTYLAKKLAQNITQQNERSFLTKLSAWAGYENEFSKYASNLSRAGKLTDNAFSEVYAAGDNVFRLAAFMNVAGTLQAKNNGKLGEEQLKQAGLKAREMFLDYDIDSRWVKAARQSVLPFVSWSYAIMPVLGRLAITKPWTMINMMAALYAMGMMGDDDEWRKSGPEAVRERSLMGMGPYNMIRVPFMGTDENPMYYNIGKSIPMMSLFEPAQGKSKLFGSDYIPGVLQPSGPYVTLLANTLLNVDPFTGKPLYGETDDGFDKMMKSGKAVWDTFAPSPATTRFLGQARDWAQEKQGPTGKPNDGLAFARLFGMSVYQYDKAETQFYQDSEIKKIKAEFHTVMNKLKRDEMSKGYPDFEAMDEQLGTLQERLDTRMAKIRGEE